MDRVRKRHGHSYPGLVELHDLLAHRESGHFRSRPAWLTSRANPSDHLIIWVIAGGMDLRVGAERHAAAAGDLVVLDPGVSHEYAPSTSTGWEWFWLHFAGLDASSLAARLRGRAARPVRRLGVAPHLVTRFSELVAAAAPNAVAPAESVQLHLDSCAYSLLGLMVRTLETGPHDLAPFTTDLSQVTGWILDHLDQQFDLADVVRASGWSSAQLNRLTRRELGMSPMQYATQLRMRHAQRLLRDSTLSVTTIAAMVGFTDPLHFSRRFRQLTGEAPTGYRLAEQDRVGQDR